MQVSEVEPGGISIHRIFLELGMDSWKRRFPSDPLGESGADKRLWRWQKEWQRQFIGVVVNHLQLLATCSSCRVSKPHPVPGLALYGLMAVDGKVRPISFYPGPYTFLTVGGCRRGAWTGE